MSDNDQTSYPPMSLLEQFGPPSKGPKYARKPDGSIIYGADGAPLPEIGMGAAIYQLFHILYLTIQSMFQGDAADLDRYMQVYGLDEDDETTQAFRSAVRSGLDAYARGVPLNEATATALRELAEAEWKSAEAGPLLALIRAKESSSDPDVAYDIANGMRDIGFSRMTIGQVKDWQSTAAATRGELTPAAGAYQIMPETLPLAIRIANQDGGPRITDSTVFDKATQDRLGRALLKHRGIEDFVEGRIDADQFLLNLSQEWAALPRDGSGLSFYDGVGNNKAASLHDMQRFLDEDRQYASLSDTHRKAATAPADEGSAPAREAFAQNARSIENGATGDSGSNARPDDPTAFPAPERTV